MPLLIDGHNLIGKLPDIHLDDPNDEDKLIARLKAYVARTGKRVTVVFDPPKQSEWFAWSDDRFEQRNLTIIFATMGRKADDVIREHIAREKDKAGLIVVTSDAAVANFARQCGVSLANVRKSEEFAREMREATSAPAPAEKPVISKAEVDAWLRVFKEPEPEPKPPPEPKLDPKEAKRLKRMAQLQKQANAGKMRRLK